MRKTMLLLLLAVPMLSRAELLSCDQQQALCDSKCQLVNIGDDKKIKVCQAKCLGERLSCSVGSGVKAVKNVAGQARDSSSDLSNKAKAFWDGMTGN